MRERETDLVSSVFSRCRSAEPGSDGPVQCCLSAHQDSQEPTAARLRFQVAGFALPHSAVSASATSVSATSARARSGSSWVGETVEHVGVRAQRVRVALDLRGVEERVDGRPHARATGRGGAAARGLQLGDGRRHDPSLRIDLPDNVYESRTERRMVRAGRRRSLWIRLPDNGPLSGRSRTSSTATAHQNSEQRAEHAAGVCAAMAIRMQRGGECRDRDQNQVAGDCDCQNRRRDRRGCGKCRYR